MYYSRGQFADAGKECKLRASGGMANKRNTGLLDKDRFKPLDREKKQWLKNLSMKKAIALEEGLLASSLIWEWRKNFFPDKPVCLKYILKKKV